MSPLEPGATIVGLRFRPGVAGATLGIPASELRNTRVPLADVWSQRGAELEERLASTPAATERRRLLEHEVLARRARSDGLDLAVLAAVRWLGRPGTRVRAISDRLGLSDRQLLRRFRVAVGYGPKTLDRVLRFQRFLAHAGTVATGDESLAGLAFELGYSDQAHLTRECVELSGLTPGRLAHTRAHGSTENSDSARRLDTPSPEQATSARTSKPACPSAHGLEGDSFAAALVRNGHTGVVCRGPSIRQEPTTWGNGR
jgi:AraC-like DNA-binding protein